MIARGAFGDAGARARGLALVDAYLATKPAVVAGFAPYTLLRLGEPVRGLSLLQEAATTNEAMNFTLLWGPYGKAARALPEFPEFLRRTGLAALWDRHGPGDGCRRIAPGDYRCD